MNRNQLELSVDARAVSSITYMFEHRNKSFFQSENAPYFHWSEVKGEL